MSKQIAGALETFIKSNKGLTTKQKDDIKDIIEIATSNQIETAKASEMCEELLKQVSDQMEANRVLNVDVQGVSERERDAAKREATLAVREGKQAEQDNELLATKSKLEAVQGVLANFKVSK